MNYINNDVISQSGSYEYAEFGMAWYGNYQAIWPRIGASTGEIFATNSISATGRLIKIDSTKVSALEDCNCSFYTYDNSGSSGVTTKLCKAGEDIINTSRPVYVMAWK